MGRRLAMKRHFSIDQVVPHAAPMSLLHSVEDYGDDWLRAKAIIRAGDLFVEDGGVPAWVGIEYMAQTVAAYAGVQARLRGDSVKVGFLVGTRKYTINTAHFAINSEFSITAKQVILGENGLGAFDCLIEGKSIDGSDIEAHASLNVFQPDNIEEILKGNA